MQIYFHSHLWSYLSRVPILVEDTVYVYMYIYIYIYTRAVQLIEFNYHAHLVSKACFLISSRSPSPAFRWRGNYYTEPCVRLRL